MKPSLSPVDKALLDEFDKLIDDPKTSEHLLQQFVEENPQFLHTPHLLNHGLYCDALISQFRLNTSLTADIAYLTKSSNIWRLVLVELEPASLRIFRRDDQATPSAEFTKRKTQIDEWRLAIKESEPEIRRTLFPIMKGHHNPIEFYYVLVIGRSSEPFTNPKWRDRMTQISGNNCQILTWDSLRRAYVAGRSEQKNVLSINKGRFSFKRLLVEPPYMFSFMESHELDISDDQENLLKQWGYDIDAWKEGRPLKVNDKYPDLNALALGRISIFE